MDRGFSLIEVLVAATLMTVAATGLAQLSVVAMRVNDGARSAAVATLLASDKLEQLRGVAWAELGPSPPDALFENTTGYFDAPHPDFIRRWSIESLAPGGAWLLQVSVIRVEAGRVHDSSRRRSGEARLADVRTRKAS